jgi:hypothetical protein
MPRTLAISQLMKIATEARRIKIVGVFPTGTKLSDVVSCYDGLELNVAAWTVVVTGSLPSNAKCVDNAELG